MIAAAIRRDSRTIRLVIRTVVMVAPLSAAPFAVAQEMPLDTVRRLERTILLERHQALLAPQPLPRETFEAWSAEFTLDVDQREAFSALLDGYALRIAPLEKELRSKVLELWPASFQYDNRARAIVPALSPKVLELYDMHSRLLDRVLDFERPLFTALENLVPDVDRPRVEQLRLIRLRTLLGISDLDNPAVTVSIATLLNGSEIAPDDALAVEAALADCRMRIIEALEDRDTLSPTAVEAEILTALVALGPYWELAVDEASRERIMGDDFSPTAPLMVDRLAELNREFVERIADLLPPRQSVKLRSRYFQVLLPEFFEEERDALFLADRLGAAFENLEADQRAVAVESLDGALLALAQELDSTAEIAVLFAPSDATTFVRLPFSSAPDSLSVGIDSLNKELRLTSLRRERRRALDRAVDAMQSLVQQHLAEHDSWRATFEHHRRVQKARDESDEFRENALAARIAELETIRVQRLADDRS